jgi:hypothetical protein
MEYIVYEIDNSEKINHHIICKTQESALNNMESLVVDRFSKIVLESLGVIEKLEKSSVHLSIDVSDVKIYDYKDIFQSETEELVAEEVQEEEEEEVQEEELRELEDVEKEEAEVEVEAEESDVEEVPFEFIPTNNFAMIYMNPEKTKLAIVQVKKEYSGFWRQSEYWTSTILTTFVVIPSKTDLDYDYEEGEILQSQTIDIQTIMEDNENVLGRSNFFIY